MPRNEALVRLSPAAPEATHAWLRYLAEWSAWNQVRGAAARWRRCCSPWGFWPP